MNAKTYTLCKARVALMAVHMIQMHTIYVSSYRGFLSKGRDVYFNLFTRQEVKIGNDSHSQTMSVSSGRPSNIFHNLSIYLSIGGWCHH